MTVTIGMVVVVVVMGMVAVRTVSMMGLPEALARHALQQPASHCIHTLQQPGSRCNICIRIELACILSVSFMKLVGPDCSRK